MSQRVAGPASDAFFYYDMQAERRRTMISINSRASPHPVNI
jgi:hypothetical protein